MKLQSKRRGMLCGADALVRRLGLGFCLAPEGGVFDFAVPRLWKGMASAMLLSDFGWRSASALR